jgi:hypothetical protein
MKSKEEIEQLAKNWSEGFDEEYKKLLKLVFIKGYTQCQEDMAIGFAEWIAQKNIKPSCSEGMWLIIKNYDDIERRLTSKELYEIYIQSINKQD